MKLDISELTDVKNIHRREINRRTLNRTVKAEARKNTPKGKPFRCYQVPTDDAGTDTVMSLSGDALAAEAGRSRGISKADMAVLVERLSEVRMPQKGKGKPVTKGGAKKVSTLPTTASSLAFKQAFELAPSGKQRKAGRWASGLVVHHGDSQKNRVAAAVFAAVETVKSDGRWSEALEAFEAS